MWVPLMREALRVAGFGAVALREDAFVVEAGS
jgi:hypothetical protein